jgi:hypothetical protein
MKQSTSRFLALLILSTIIVIGCGGGGGTANPPPPPTNASPGGIWEGTSSTGGTILGLVTETGEFHFLQDDGVQYFGTVNTSQNALSANFTGVTQIGTVFLDGSTTGTGTLTGTVQERMSMSGNSSFRTAGGTNVASSVTLTYDNLYERDSSLATIAGNYLDTTTNAVINVNGNGVVFSQDAVTGCIVNGTISIIDARYNAYRVQYSFSSCRAPYTILNGTTANGLGALDNTVAPEQAIIGVVNATAGYALTGIFPRT